MEYKKAYISLLLDDGEKFALQLGRPLVLPHPVESDCCPKCKRIIMDGSTYKNIWGELHHAFNREVKMGNTIFFAVIVFAFFLAVEYIMMGGVSSIRLHEDKADFRRRLPCLFGCDWTIPVCGSRSAHGG